jgi:sulfatase maturation enzyme AslB (radical SAM superfamily)
VSNNSLPTIPLQNSRFLHLFQKEPVFCLQHSLTFEKVYGGKILQLLYDNFQTQRTVGDVIALFPSDIPENMIKETISLLHYRGLLVNDPHEDLLFQLSLANDGCNKTPIDFLYIIPTINCNFKCSYCFVVNGGKESNIFMDINVAKQGIDLFAQLTENIEQTPRITYYGGEPLLNADVVYASMKYIRTLERKKVFKRKVRIGLNTNGSLINEDTVSIFAKLKPSVSISIDGPAHLHDAARKDRGGNNTFDQALAGYHLLQKHGIAVGISCTISPFNLRHIEEVTEFIVTELKPRGMGFNILIPQITHGRANDYDYELAANQVIRAFKFLRQHGIYEDRMMRRVNPYVNKTLHL